MASNIQVILQKKHFFSYYPYLFQGFAFNSVNEEVAPQRLKCHVEICHVDTEDSPCSTGCFAPTTTTATSSPTTTGGLDYDEIFADEEGSGYHEIFADEEGGKIPYF